MDPIELVKSSVIEAQASINAIAHANALRARKRATVSSERASSIDARLYTLIRARIVLRLLLRPSPYPRSALMHVSDRATCLNSMGTPNGVRYRVHRLACICTHTLYVRGAYESHDNSELNSP
jgi:hypothetical protein